MAEKIIKIGEKEFKYSLLSNSAIEKFVIKVYNKTSYQRSYYFFTKTEDWILTAADNDNFILTIYGTTDNGEVLNKDFYQKESSGEMNKLSTRPYQSKLYQSTILSEVKENVVAPNVSYPVIELKEPQEQDNNYYVLIVKHKETKFIQLLKSDSNQIKDSTVPLQSRTSYYKCKLYQLDKNNNQYIVNRGTYSLVLKTCNSQKDVELLKEKAVTHISGLSVYKVLHLYRNKPSYHSTIIESKKTGIMKKYVKDFNGDQFSSINGKISGLHFCATPVNSSGDLSTSSYFGDYRIMVDPEYLVDGCNLYFADFFCMRSPRHWVLLVLTKRGSKEDKFCENRLVKLDIENNPFFYISQDGYKVTSLEVEILYTEDINLREMRLKHGFEEKTTLSLGRGIKSNGVPKNSSCGTCN